MGSLISGAIACAIVATFSWLLLRRKKAGLQPVETKSKHRYDLSHERTAIETNGVSEVATTEQDVGKVVVTEVAHETTADSITDVECCRSTEVNKRPELGCTSPAKVLDSPIGSEINESETPEVFRHEGVASGDAEVEDAAHGEVFTVASKPSRSDLEPLQAEVTASENEELPLRAPNMERVIVETGLGATSDIAIADVKSVEYEVVDGEARGSSVDLPSDALGQISINGDQSQTDVSSAIDDAIREISPHSNKRYQPPQNKPRPRIQIVREKRSTDSAGIPFEIRACATLDRHGFCSSIKLIAERPPEAPDEVEWKRGKSKGILLDLADSWYEVSVDFELSRALEEGFGFSSTVEQNTQWQLTGRDVYVLAGKQEGIPGYVSTTRLQIGFRQLILCRRERLVEVREILREAGCDNFRIEESGPCLPSGWVLITEVTPQRPVPFGDGSDILNILRPLPDIALVLDGGVRLHGSVWLEGYPPRILVTGDLPAGTVATIDGLSAEISQNREISTDTCGDIGSHTVFCGGRSVNYSIVSPTADWRSWPAYANPLGTICGAEAQLKIPRQALISVPMGNRVLIGANPGQIFMCDGRSGRSWRGYTPFPAIWALPDDPLHADRQLARIMLVTEEELSANLMTSRKPQNERERVRILRWCEAIRNCQKKRLKISPEASVSKDLWNQYTVVARMLWRKLR